MTTNNDKNLVKAEIISQRIENAFEDNYKEEDESYAQGKAINEFITILLEEGITVQYLVTDPEQAHIKMKLDYGTLGTLRVASHMAMGIERYRYQVYKAHRLYGGTPLNTLPLERTPQGKYKVGIYNLAELLMLILSDRARLKANFGGEQGYEKRKRDNEISIRNLKGRRKSAWKGSKLLVAK